MILSGLVPFTNQMTKETTLRFGKGRKKMSRLTNEPFRRKSDDSLENYKVRRYGREEWETSVQKVINKLGKLEDIEEELGCPLEVMIKALNDGINVVCFDEKIHFHSSPSLNKYDEFYFSETYYPYGDSCCDATDDSYQVKLSDYQKTWWLKGEKENE